MGMNSATSHFVPTVGTGSETNTFVPKPLNSYMSFWNLAMSHEAVRELER